VAKVPWRRAGPGSPPRAAADAGEQSCPSLQRALERILKHDKPEILDLGPMCGASVVHLASKGALVSVEEFIPPPPPPEPDPSSPRGEPPPKEPIRIEQPDGRFHLVVAWEQVDFVPPDRLADFGKELHRLLTVGGYVLLFARSGAVGAKPSGGSPGRFRIVADDKLIHEESGLGRRKRWVHPTREIERALAPLSIQGIHLQRNQMREFLALKKNG
jgi:hypothetical protein